LDLPRGGRYEPPAHGAPVAPLREPRRRPRPARGPDRGLPRRGRAGGPAPRARGARALSAGRERARRARRDRGAPRGVAADAAPRPRRPAAAGAAGDGRRQQPVGASGRRAARRAGEAPPPGRADRALGSGGAGGGGPPAPDRAGGPEPAAGLRGAHHAQRPAVDRLSSRGRWDGLLARHLDEERRRAAPHAPGAVPATSSGSSREWRIACSPQRSITSPRAMPAFAAGPPAVTSATRAPSAAARPRERARSGVTDWIATPIQPRTTTPCARNWSITQRARLIGTAKPMPTLPPAGLTMAAL